MSVKGKERCENFIILQRNMNSPKHSAFWAQTDRIKAKDYSALTSMPSKLSCWLILLRMFFLLLSCNSPASNSSSRMKYAC
jgi:hypothetical protein